MTVNLSLQSRVQPGRFQDAIGLAHETEKVCERHGAREVRLLRPAVAGEATNQLTLSIEFDDIEKYGAWSDEMGADSDVQSLQMRVMEPNSPVTVENQSLSIELPTGRTPKPGRGTIVEIYVTRPTPGQYEKSVEQGITACNVVEKAGAVNARLSAISFSGMGQGLTVASWEWADMKAFAKGFRAWETDKKAKALADAINQANPASTIVWSGLYQVIPL